VFGPDFVEEYERVRDRVENGITLMSASMKDLRYFAKITAACLIVIAASLVVIAAGSLG
jgi:hypothetical protein